MRKIVLFIAALLFMAVPAMAASTVTITCSGAKVADVNWVTVHYNSDVNRIRAFGLDITLTATGGNSDGNITQVVPLDPCGTKYRIYPDQISIVNGDVNDYMTPYALTDINDANVTIEMGSLYTTDTKFAIDPCDPNNNRGYNKVPGLSGDLLKFRVDGNACNYKVDANVLRGGIVMEDPYETPTTNLPRTGNVCAVVCTVPNIVGMKSADANAALIAAGFTVGTRTSAYSDTVEYPRVISQGLTGVQPCLTAVPYQWSEGSSCYVGRPDYTTQWTPAGRPICWCYPRQCHGDADGKKQGSIALGYTYVGSNDLDIMAGGWMILDPTKGPGIVDLKVAGTPVACADFKHDRQGSVATGYMRIGSNDLDEMATYWMVLEPTKTQPGKTPPPANCLPGNKNP